MKISLPVASTILLLLVGCASSPVYQLTKLEQEQYADVPSETVVNDLQAKLVQAKTDRLDYYAPASFAKAKDAAASIKGLPLDKDHREELLEYAVMAQKSIAAGYTEKEKAVKVFADVLALDARLKELGAPTLQPAEYKALDRRLGKLMGTLEKGGNAESDQDSASLKGDMEALKIRITKQKSLGMARALNKALQDDNATALAPKSMQEAKDDLERADAYIQMHPDDQDGIAKVAETALIAARHAQWIAARVKELTAVQTPPFEDIILGDEQRLTSIGDVLSVGDIRDKPLDQQAAVLVAYVQGVETELDKTHARNTTLNNEVTHCQATAGTADTLSQQLQSENALLKQKVMFLETNAGMLKNQLKLLQDLLYAKTGQKVPEMAVVPAQEPQAVQAGKGSVENGTSADAQATSKGATTPPATAAVTGNAVSGTAVTPSTATVGPAKTSAQKPSEASTAQGTAPAKETVEPSTASTNAPAESIGKSGESPAKTTAEPSAASAKEHAVSVEKSGDVPFAGHATAPAKTMDEAHKAAVVPASSSSSSTNASAAVVDNGHQSTATGTDTSTDAHNAK